MCPGQVRGKSDYSRYYDTLGQGIHHRKTEVTNFNGDLTRLDRSGLAKTLLDLRDANFDSAELSIGE